MSRRKRNLHPSVDGIGFSRKNKSSPIRGPLERQTGQAASSEQNSLNKQFYSLDQRWASDEAWIVGSDGQLVRLKDYDLAPCTTTGDCASGYVCSAGNCIRAFDAGTARISGDTINQAIAALNLDVQGGGQACPDRETVQPPEGVDDEDVNSCRPAPGDTTTAPCTTATCGDGDIDPDDTYCDDPLCSEDADCPTGEVCLDGVCVSGCGSDEECPEGFACIQPETGDGPGVCREADECQNDSECGQGEVCQKIIDPDTGTPSTTGACVVNPCPSGFSYSSGECEPDPCSDDEDCPSGLACLAGSDGGPLGCRPIPCGGAGDAPCTEGLECRVGADGSSACVPTVCESDGDCPVGYACAGPGSAGGGCVADPERDPDTATGDSCKNYCDSHFKSTGETKAGCGGLTCSKCAECTSINNIFGQAVSSCQPLSESEAPCSCPKGPKPLQCQKCDETSGSIVDDFENCEVCCVAPSAPCAEDCPLGNSDSVKVCINLAGGEFGSDGVYDFAAAQVQACKKAEAERQKSCEDKGGDCDCTVNQLQCTADSQCGGVGGLIWAQGSDTAYRFDGFCNDGWDGNAVGGTCDVTEVPIPVDPVTGQPV